MDDPLGKPPNIEYDSWVKNELESVKHRTVWTIENCSKRFKEYRKSWLSNPFKVIGLGVETKWIFKLDPIGSFCQNPDHEHPYPFKCHSGKSECHYYPSIELGDWSTSFRFNAVKRIYINGTELRTKLGETGWSSMGLPVYLSRTFLKDDVVNDTLTIVCDIELTADAEIKTTEEYGYQIESRGIENNLAHVTDEFEENIIGSRESSDVIIKCYDKEFYCHQSVLSARSPVFRAMFQAKMKEKETGSIDIEEFPSEVVKKMLFYVYSGIVPDVNIWGKELLNIAEKYQLQHLKMSIGEKLVSIIDEDNCVEYLVLGDLFNLKEMKDAAVHSIKRNVDRFMESKNWKKDLQNLSSSLVLEILERVLEK